jgi:hypothetical protein
MLHLSSDDPNEENLKSFFEKIFMGPPKKVYELLGRYGYFLERIGSNQKTIIIKD